LSFELFDFTLWPSCEIEIDISLWVCGRRRPER